MLEMPDYRRMGFRDGSDLLVSEMLSLQFDLLQRFVPMDYWLLAQQENGDVKIVESFCAGTRKQATLPSAVLGQGWHDAAVMGDFQYRFLSAAQTIRMGGAATPCGSFGLVFRSELGHGCNDAPAIVAGFRAEALIPSCSTAQLRGGALCLEAIGQVLNLRAWLHRADGAWCETRRQTHIDPLTQALNRIGWEKQLRAMAGLRQDVAVAFLDLDSFKQVNDFRGHAAGDALLRLAASTMKAVVRRGDCVARLGGDEFAILLPNATACDADGLKDRLDLALRAVDISASIGVALASEGGSVGKAVELADARMYQAKRLKHSSPHAKRTRTWAFSQKSL